MLGRISILLGKGNKARVQATTHVGGETRPLKLVSDGARMRITLAAGKQPKDQPTPGQLHRALSLRFTRLGLTARCAAVSGAWWRAAREARVRCR